MPVIDNFDTRFSRCWPDDWHDLTVLAAVSGGADSVALLRALAAAGSKRPERLIVAHFNHALRHEADDDEAFVRELAARLELPCIIGRGQPSSGAGGVEEAAREARYAFLKNTAAELGARYVVTAHTADDQAETVLHRIVRGTGIAGLAGMRRARPLSQGVTLLRPLLTVRRRELLDYLTSLGQCFREDATNAERRFTRNRLRHELLPQLAQQYNLNVSEALVRLAQLAGETQSVLDEWVAELVARAATFGPNQITLDPSQLGGQPRIIIREVFIAAWRRQGWPEQAMGFDEWDSLADDLLLPGTRTGPLRVLPGGVTVVREANDLVICRN
ncbi:MAG TPA: tRNA lysidine(34) synthetase TilS [Pirellulales bacterium]|nr:tRNA lysidine(34) synthetase TilS [Pirellulales bacterium]